MSDQENLPVGPVPEGQRPLPEGQLRVGDAERQQAAMALGEHFATGRLDQQEYDERVQAAYAARTRVDLQRLFLDLPDPAPFRVPDPQPPARAAQLRPRRRPAVLLPVFPLLFIGLIVASVVAHFPVFPLFFVFLWLGWGRRAWR